jgi:predicted enzyme related to lactoylglutathione lyase
MEVEMSALAQNNTPFHIVDLNYVSLYVKDFLCAIGFYSRVFGAAESVDEKGTTYGWRMGSNWLTIFPDGAGTHPDSNPRNAEFAIQLSTVEEVDALHCALMVAGAREHMTPGDTKMYEPMRFSCVDDPFGVRIDVYCPLSGSVPDRMT